MHVHMHECARAYASAYGSINFKNQSGDHFWAFLGQILLYEWRLAHIWSYRLIFWFFGPMPSFCFSSGPFPASLSLFLAFLHSNIRGFWGFFRNYTYLGSQNSAKKAEILDIISKFPNIHMFLFIWGHMSYILLSIDLLALLAFILDAFN